MITLWFAGLWAKVWKYILLIGAVLAGIAVIFLKGRAAGVKHMQAKVANIQVKADVAQANAAQVESRHETDVQVSNLPEAPAQPVSTADPATAAGQLRDDGFTRD